MPSRTTTTSTTSTPAVVPSAETLQLRRASAPPCTPSQRSALPGAEDKGKSRRSSWPLASERPLRSALKRTSQSQPLAPLPFDLPTILPTSPRDRIGDVKILKFKYPVSSEYLAAHPELQARARARASPAVGRGGSIRPASLAPSTWHAGAPGSPMPHAYVPRNIILVRSRAFRIVAAPKKGREVIPPAPLARDLPGPPEAQCGRLRFELPPRKSIAARMTQKWRRFRNELRGAVY